MKKIEDTKLLITHVLYIAIKDYLYLHHQNTKYQYKTANDFLFNDDYLIDWGDITLSPRELLDYVDIDLDYIRDRIRSKQQEPYYNKEAGLAKGAPLL